MRTPRPSIRPTIRPTIRLSLADATWLRLDRREDPLVVTAVLWLRGTVDPAALGAVLAERLTGPNPRFRSRVRRARLPLAPPRWEPDPHFDVARHLTRVDLAGGGEHDLEEVVSGLLAEPLDARERPPWRLVVVDGYRGPAGGTAGGTAGGAATSVVVARLHHALADGSALVRVLLDLTDELPGEPPAGGVDAAAGPPRPGRGRAVLGRLLLAGAVPLTAVGLLALTPEPRTALRGRLGGVKGAAWVPPRRLTDVKAAARARGATVNDVLLAAVAGGLRRHLAAVAPGRPLPGRLRVVVPVDVGAPGGRPTARAGNRFGLLPLRLPVGEPDPLARLRAVTRSTRRAKRSPVPLASAVLVGVLGLVPGPLRGGLARLLGSRVTAVVTNVPGPREPRSLAGVRLDGVAFWVPQAAEVGLGVSLFSYDGTVRIGVAADTSLVPDAQRLADAVDAELSTLLGRA